MSLVGEPIPISHVPEPGVYGSCPICAEAMVFPRQSFGPIVYRHVFCRAGHTFLLHRADLGFAWVELVAPAPPEALRGW